MHGKMNCCPDQFKALNIIGRSSLLKTDVVCCQYKPNGSILAVKCTEIDSCSTSLMALLQREVRMSKILFHPNIISYSSTFLHHSKLCILMPLMEYGSCTDIVISRFKYGLPENVIAVVIREILKALSYIHGMHLIHRSVKGSHILLSKKGEVKLTGHRNMIELMRDGMPVSKVHDFPMHDTSLLPWLSPEILQQNMQGYDCKSDIYSVGITACELANGHAPFIDMPSTQMLLEKLNGTIPFLLDHTTVEPAPDMSDDSPPPLTVNINHEVTRISMIKMACSRRFSAEFHQFIKDCLEKDPDTRPSARELEKHPFLRQVKHKSNAEVLHSIFKELTPLDVVVGDKQDDLHLSEELQGLTVDKKEWDFT